MTKESKSLPSPDLEGAAPAVGSQWNPLENLHPEMWPELIKEPSRCLRDRLVKVHQNFDDTAWNLGVAAGSPGPGRGTGRNLGKNRQELKS